jgi:hypothetical protein
MRNWIIISHKHYYGTEALFLGWRAANSSDLNEDRRQAIIEQRSTGEYMIMQTCSSGDAIEDLILATYGPKQGLREQHVFRQALHGLVRLAKSEQLLEMKMNVARGAGAMTAAVRPDACLGNPSEKLK